MKPSILCSTTMDHVPRYIKPVFRSNNERNTTAFWLGHVMRTTLAHTEIRWLTDILAQPLVNSYTQY